MPKEVKPGQGLSEAGPLWKQKGQSHTVTSQGCLEIHSLLPRVVPKDWKVATESNSEEFQLQDLIMSQFCQAFTL